VSSKNGYDADFSRDDGMKQCRFQRQSGGAGGARRWLCLLALLWPLAASAAESIDLIIKGVAGEVHDNVRSYIGPLTTDDLKSWRSSRIRLESVTREALEATGYYEPVIVIEQLRGEVSINVIPGEPVRVGRLHLVFEGEAGNDIAFTALRESLPLKEGDILHHGHYEGLKSAIQALAVERGYFDAVWTRREVSVDIKTHRADVDLVYASGPRFLFGPVSFVGQDGAPQTAVRAEVMALMVPFTQGEPFAAAGIIKLNKSLLDSRYFSEIRVRHLREAAVGLEVPVRVTVASKKPNDMDVGIGYSTDVQARLSLAWRRPLINDRGHGVKTSAELSQVRRSFDATYSVPWKHPLEDVLQYIYGVQREDVEDVVTYSTIVGIQRQIQRDKGWKHTYSLRWNRESFERPDGEEGKSDLLLPGISLDRVRSKGGVDPHWGDRQYYQAEFASSKMLSDADFITLRAGFRLLRTVAGRHQFLLRADGGSILTDTFDDVPLTMRFFAGGDQSVRGYDYKSLSPRDAEGIAIGARNLGTASLEYDYTFTPKWRAAVFTDAGNAFDSVTESFNKVGAGVGMRWISPVGPIRLDFAWAVSEPDTSFRVHFSMGSSL